MKKILLLIIATILLYSNEVSELQTCEVEDIKNLESKTAMENWLDGNFGLKPYRVNYLLPYGYRDGEYKEYTPADQYTNIEAELQVSLKLNVGNNFFGLHEKYYLSYSHKAFWQIYSKSSPFRETIYNPEAFVVIPIFDNVSIFQIRSLKFALAHRSNGQGNIEEVSTIKAVNSGLQNQSRSINYIYSEVTLQHDTFITEFKLWVPLPEDDATNDNPDLMDYTGYSSFKFSYFLHKHMFTLDTRTNISTGYGAVEFAYSYPLIKDTYLYAKIFSGYGESLIDYDNYITKFSIGFSFSR